MSKKIVPLVQLASIDPNYDRHLVLELWEAVAKYATNRQCGSDNFRWYLLEATSHIMNRQKIGEPNNTDSFPFLWSVSPNSLFGVFLKRCFPEEHRIWIYICFY